MWPAGAEYPMAMGHGPASAAAAASPSGSSAAATALRAPHSPWQSPVPYLFGGLAAMLGLIALSLLALACSYWKLSGSLLAAGEPSSADAERQAGTGGRGGDGGDDEKGAAAGKDGPGGDRWREHVVVIMAGDEMPTFLATPASGRADDDDPAASCSAEKGWCVECGARTPPAAGGSEDDAPSRSEQSLQVTASGSSVNTGT